MESRARRERVPCEEKVMAALGAQEWFRRAERGERQRPRGSSVGVVRVCVFVRTFWWKG